MGVVDSREKAFDRYSDAISEGKGAYLLERDEDIPNTFKVCYYDNKSLFAADLNY